MIEIPLQGGAANAHQTFSMQLGDNFLDFRLNYLTRFPGWTMDVYQNESLLIAGAMLVPNGELTISHDLGIGRLLFYGDEPTLENLGMTNHLVWVDG